MKEFFNVLESGHTALWFPAIGLIAVIIGIFFIRTKIFRIKMNLGVSIEYRKNFFYIWTGFAILWTIGSFFVVGSEYIESVWVIKMNKYQEVEGYVENFEPVPISGNKNESFTVNGVNFEYSDYTITSGFNNTKSHGGPIDSGKYVKIRYHEGRILQLWVKE